MNIPLFKIIQKKPFHFAFGLFFLLTSILMISQTEASSPKFEIDSTDFPNPERGFWGNTINRKYYKIPTHGTIPQSVLTNLDNEFNSIRTKKQKIIPRFDYNTVDAPLDSMLKHIAQLGPIIQKHADVVAALEAGLIGKWGEWHSSPNISGTDFEKLRKVLYKWLEVVPKERSVALRYNVHKRAIYNSNEPITAAEAFSGSNKSRTAAHGDCFVANTSDAGTYKSKGDFAGWGLGREAEIDYLSKDNMYVMQNGETCGVGAVGPKTNETFPYSTCTIALKELEQMRWDMMNNSFKKEILQQWRDQGCYNEISKRLGYRFSILSATFDDDVTDGNFDATIALKNWGFGKVFNQKKLELVLRNTSTKMEYTLPLSNDVRFWSPGLTHTVNLKVPIPKRVPFGSYEVFLAIKDPAPRLYGIPEYSIRFANKDVWDATKGYNSLKHTAKISSFNPDTTLITSVKNNPSLSHAFKLNVSVVSQSLEINYYVPTIQPVSFEIYQTSGTLISNHTVNKPGMGQNKFSFPTRKDQGHALTPGVYFLRMVGPNNIITKKFIIK